MSATAFFGGQFFGGEFFSSSSSAAPEVSTLSPAGRSTGGKGKRKVIIGERLYEVESLRDVEFILKRVVREESEPVTKAAIKRIRVVDRVAARIDESPAVALPIPSVEVDWSGLWAQLAAQDRTYADILMRVLAKMDEDDIEAVLLAIH
jgi:hypothetical protein